MNKLKRKNDSANKVYYHQNHLEKIHKSLIAALVSKLNKKT